MIFADLAQHSAVFVDANVIIYAVSSDPTYGATCQLLLKRIETNDLFGYTSASVLSDVAHRLMTIDATLVFGWPYTGIGRRLRRHWDEISKLLASADADFDRVPHITRVSPL